MPSPPTPFDPLRPPSAGLRAQDRLRPFDPSTGSGVRAQDRPLPKGERGAEDVINYLGLLY